MGLFKTGLGGDVAPAFLATACLYYLIWQTVAQQLAIPELIAEALFPAYGQVNQVILIGLPLVFVSIFFFAFSFPPSGGPIYRIEKDLGNHG